MSSRFVRFLATVCMLGSTCAAEVPGGYVPRLDFGARLEPVGRILHGAGQDPQGFRDYAAQFDDQHQPVIAMTYIGLRGSVEDIQAWGARTKGELEAHAPHRVLPQIGLNMTAGNDDGTGMDTRISEGKFDAQIEAFGDAIASFGRPVYVRIGYEFEGSWNGYQPATFVQTWKRITDHLRGRNLPVATVWCAAGASAGWISLEQMMAFYPGDDYVDWWGVDLFSEDEFTKPQLFTFLDAARAHRKPVMIGEMTPRYVGVLQGEKSWSRWFEPLFGLLKTRPEIKATAYINWEWSEWSQKLGFSWFDWGDARLEKNPVVLGKWVEALRDPIFEHAAQAP